MFKKLAILACIGAAIHFSGAAEKLGFGASTKRSVALVGKTFTQQGPTTVSDRNGPVRFGVEFLDSERANMLANGEKSGPTMSYVIKKNKMVITHDCGTWKLTLNDDGTLYKPDDNWTFAEDAPRYGY
jgi:hypothetical protein